MVELKVESKKEKETKGKKEGKEGKEDSEKSKIELSSLSGWKAYLATLGSCLVVVLISVVFELSLEHLNVKTPECFQPVLSAMKEELMVLGFIGVLAFFAQNAPISEEEPLLQLMTTRISRLFPRRTKVFSGKMECRGNERRPSFP